MISTTDMLRQAIDQRKFSEPMKAALKALLDAQGAARRRQLPLRGREGWR